jgi:M6 family metalloprotease-like protein
MKKLNKLIIELLVFAGIAFLSFGSLSANVLEIHGMSKQPLDSSQYVKAHAGFKSDVSKQNLLGLDRSGKSLLPSTALSAAEPRTLRMCAIRVQFQLESPDDDSTTGTGHFDFRTYEQFFEEERHGVDPAPHNREYFAKHIEALNNYWHTVSNGNLTIEGTVFPLESDSVYTLDKTMGYYGSQEPSNGLGEFFHNALRLADQDDDINWADYDVFVIFHAGSDRQNDLGFPPTPYDLFTGFVIMGSPVPVEDSTILIYEGMIMPETASQDNRATALNAVMAHEFGHQLGLVDLYDSHTFTTFVGDFSLMDNNGFGTGVDLGFERTRTILGTLPLYPDAWSRAYLGFDQVVEIDEGINFAVKAAEQEGSGNKIYKVPISENEYYLIENRQVDPDRDGGASLKADLDATGVILGPAPNPDVVPPGQPAPLTREYDYLMPGSGIVIWHIDESVAWMDYDGDGVNNFYDNDLQWYYIKSLDSEYPPWQNRPFMRLVEADGIIDFGGDYWTGFGRQQDLFEANNNNHFGPSTNPSTRSNSGAYTGIDISDISGIDTLMYFDLDQQIRAEGWPHHADSSQFPPVLYDMDGDGVDEVFVSGNHYILGFKPDGDFIFDPVPGSVIISERPSTPRGPLNEITYIDTLRVIASLGLARQITTPPTIYDLDNDGVAEIAVGTATGEVFIYKLEDLNNNGRADQVDFDKVSNYPVSAPIVVADADHDANGYEFIAGDSAGGLFVIDAAAQTLSQTIGFNHIQQFAISEDFQHAYVLDYTEEAGQKSYFIHDINDPAKFKPIPGSVVGFSAGMIDTTSEIWLSAVTDEGMLYTFNANLDHFGDYFENNPVSLGSSISTAPILYPNFSKNMRSQLIFGGNNQIFVYDLNGTPLSNFPQDVDLHTPAGEITSTPIAFDMTGDEYPEILFGTSAGEIYMISQDGSRLVNSPIAAPESISTSLAFSPKSLDFSNRGSLYAITDDGLIYSFILPSVQGAAADSYLQYGGGSDHRNFQEKPINSLDTGDGLLTKCYNYPNPADQFTNIRFELNDDADANIRIYDLSGRLIYEDNMQAIGGMANEYRWDLADFPSGVYYCRLEVKGSGKSDVQFWNIAVVK